MFSAALNPVQSSDQSLFLSLADGVLQAPLAYQSNASPRSRIVLTGGEVFINGTHADNVARVTGLDAQTIRVSLVGIETREFSIVDVDSIRFVGRKGDDYFRNDTAIPVNAWGLEGNDRIIGGSGNDLLYGGRGNDLLEGLQGNDQIFGEWGDDDLRGGDGDDWISGALGNDLVFGQAGEDMVTGDAGNDQVRGGDGNDTVHGWTGNDLLFGDNGNDWLSGYAGDDELNGGSGNDVLMGGGGNDQLQGAGGIDELWGQSGNDVLRVSSGASQFHGGHGNDLIYGTSAADYITGGNDDDTIFAGGGNDLVLAGNGADKVYGEAGDDRLLGNGQADLLHGGSGNDKLYGGDGNDELISGSGLDYLGGQNGVDVLISTNDGQADVLSGGPGGDHVLYFNRDKPGTDSGDLRLQLVNKTSAWTVNEMRVLNRGLQRLHDATGNSRLVRDVVVGKDLTLEKYRSLSGGAAAINYMTYRTVNGRTTYDRAIRFADWDETNEPLNAAYELVLVHEIAHNFDDDFELAAVPVVSINDWNAFTAQSGWRKNRLNNNYVRSGDGQWWYRRNAQFYRSYGNWSPAEDWGTAWEMFFDPDAERPPANSNLGRKLASVTSFMNKMSS